MDKRTCEHQKKGLSKGTGVGTGAVMTSGDEEKNVIIAGTQHTSRKGMFNGIKRELMKSKLNEEVHYDTLTFF